MSTSSSKLSAVLLAASAVLAGCAPTAPRYESSFGHSVRAAVAAQTIDPGAVRNVDPVAGIDGRAAAAAQARYEASFRNPTAQEPAMTTGSQK